MEEMGEKYIEPKCSICTHKSRDEIEMTLLEGVLSQKDIAAKFSLNPASLSNHKNKHMLLNMRNKLKISIQKSINDGIKPSNTGELCRLMDYVDGMDKKDPKIQYEKQDIGVAIAEKLKSIPEEDNKLYQVIIDFDDFKDNLVFNAKFRQCKHCPFYIVKSQGYKKCLGQELGCLGVGNGQTDGKYEVLEND